MINKKEYPLILLQNIEKLFQEVRKIADSNNDIIRIAINDELKISLEDKTEYSNFSFTISQPKYEKSKVEYHIEYNPKNSTSLDSLKAFTDHRTVLNNLNIWLNLLRGYDRINLTPEEKILNEYEKEFYDEFEIIDEDADIKPFDLNRQLIIHNFLSHTIEILDRDNGDYSELKEEAKELKENIPRLTKKTTIKKLSRLLAKIRQKSLPLLKEILDVAKKELYKKAVSGGFKMIGHFIDNLV